MGKLKDIVDYSSSWSPWGQFMEKHPRFLEAEITEKPHKEYAAIHDPLRKHLVHPSEQFHIKLKNKYYIIGVKYQRWNEKVICREWKEDGPKSRRRSRAIPYNSIDLSKGEKRFKRDCQIRTVAAVLNVKYSKAHQYLSERGWSEKSTGNIEHSKGLSKNRWDEILELYNKKKVFYWSKYNAAFGKFKDNRLGGKNGMTVKTAVKLLPKGTYIVTVSGHVCCVIDNQLFDGWNCSNCRVRQIWKVIDI